MWGGEADRPGTVLTEEILGENTGTLMCPREMHVAQAGLGLGAGGQWAQCEGRFQAALRLWPEQRSCHQLSGGWGVSEVRVSVWGTFPLRGPLAIPVATPTCPPSAVLPCAPSPSYTPSPSPAVPPLGRWRGGGVEGWKGHRLLLSPSGKGCIQAACLAEAAYSRALMAKHASLREVRRPAAAKVGGPKALTPTRPWASSPARPPVSPPHPFCRVQPPTPPRAL